MNDSGTLWESYKTTEQRAGPLPMASTPKTTRSIRGPETPNVTNIIVVGAEQDENIDILNRTQNLHLPCSSCKELRIEIQKLREKVERQSVYIKTLNKCINSTSEMDSSESQHGNGSNASTMKSAKVQRVTPTKRETSGSSSSTSSSTASPAIRNLSAPSPIVRQILQQLPTPGSARSANEMTPRNLRPLTNRTSSSSSSSPQVLQTPTNRRQRLPPIIRTPHSLPMGTQRSRSVVRQRLPSPLPQLTQSATTRQSHSRRRLFANDPVNLTRYQRTQSENAIEHFPVSPVKDDQWSQACPPRFYLEQNRPEFIERLVARQSIIKAASEKRAEIEHRKRAAARAVACGQKTEESVRRDLLADSTKVKAFFEKDMKEITLRNIRKSKSYQTQIWRTMANVDKVANRIISHQHSQRTRSTSRHRLSRNH